MLIPLTLAACASSPTSDGSGFDLEGGADASSSEAGPDGSTQDATGAKEAAASADSAALDASGDDVGALVDTGVDGPMEAGPSYDAAIDAGGDARADGSVDAGNAADAGIAGDGSLPTYTSGNPLQVDLGSVLNVDTVANTSATGKMYPPLTPMDGSGYDFFTAGVGNVSGDSTGGLPDDGLFAADANHPTAQMAFNNTSVAPNSVLLGAAMPDATTFPIVATHFSSLQLYLTSTEGASNAQVTLTYSDASTDVTSFTVPDWFSGATAPVFVVHGGLSRFSSTAPSDFRDGASVYGVTIGVSSAKILTSVTVTKAAGSSRVVLYGATAY